MRPVTTLVTLLAALAISACTAEDEPTAAPQPQPVARVQSIPEPTTTTAACWSDPSGDPYAWRKVFNRISGDPVRAVAFLNSLPTEAEGCSETDKASLAQVQILIDAMYEDRPELRP